MKSATHNLPARIRLALLKGVARLLAWMIAPALKPATVAARRAAPHGGRVIDGEFRRIDERNTPTHW